MKKILTLSLIVISTITRSQQIEKKIPFILLVDNEVPSFSIIQNCKLLIKDSTQKIKFEVPFKYNVGNITLLQSQFDTIKHLNHKENIVIQFSTPKNKTNYVESFIYQVPLEPKWFNELYIILKIFNYDNLESRNKYIIKKGDYVVQKIIPGFSTILTEKKEYWDYMAKER